jgi:hypothetical protein
MAGVSSICSYYLRNSCTNGTACRFSHQITSPEPAPVVDERVCSHFLRGSCRYGHTCQYSHGSHIGIRKVSQAVQSVGSEPESPRRTHTVPFGICKFFVQGRCKNGVDCPFSHSPVEVQPGESQSTWPPARATNQQQNPIFLRSESTSKTPCIYFAKGKCSNGVACSFSHAGTTPGSNSSINLQHICEDTVALKGSVLVPCKFFLQGSCTKGGKCQFFHPCSDTPSPSINVHPLSAAVQVRFLSKFFEFGL